MNVKVNALHLVMTFMATLETSKGVRRILDDEGNMIVPIERFGDFCHDLGLMLGRSIENIAEPEEEGPSQE